MSNNSSQICTPDISARFMNFIENGEFDEMVSLIIVYFNKNLTICIIAIKYTPTMMKFY